MTATMTKERAQFYADVITTAVEGGINYWAAVSDYRWEGLEPEDVRVTVHEEDPDGSYETARGRYTTAGVRVDVPAIAKAFALINSDDPIKFLDDGVRIRWRRAYRECTSGDLDAGDCDGDLDAGDCDGIVQLAVFGEVVYG